MTDKSVPERGSLLANPQNLADAAAWLMLDEDQAEVFFRCLAGESLERMLGVVDWLAEHEADPHYDPAAMLVMWAKKRGAGSFRPASPSAAERTWTGNSPGQDAEIAAAVETNGRG